jgi:hypothetical protein
MRPCKPPLPLPKAEYGPVLGGDPDAVTAGCERFITRQVYGTRPREEWRQDVGARWVAGSCFGAVWGDPVLLPWLHKVKTA